MAHHPKSLLVLFFSVILFIEIPAQEARFAAKGVTELSGVISFSNFTSVSRGRTGDAISLFTFAPQVGYFVSDGFEIGLGTGITLIPGFSVLSPEDEESTSFFQFFFTPSYNISSPNSNIFPFIEGQLGYTSTSSGNNTASGFSYGGRAGVKIAAVDHLLISISGQYLAITFNESGAKDRNGINYLTIGVGVSGYF